MHSHHPNISQALSTRSSEHCRHARGSSWPSPLLLRGVMESEGPPDRLISVLLLPHVLGGRLSGATSCICVVTLHSTVQCSTVRIDGSDSDRPSHHDRRSGRPKERSYRVRRWVALHARGLQNAMY